MESVVHTTSSDCAALNGHTDGQAVIDALLVPEGSVSIIEIRVRGEQTGCLDFVNDTSRIFGANGDLIGIDDWSWRVATPQKALDFLNAVRANKLEPRPVQWSVS
jgi:hypothetical protein